MSLVALAQGLVKLTQGIVSAGLWWSLLVSSDLNRTFFVAGGDHAAHMSQSQMCGVSLEANATPA